MYHLTEKQTGRVVRVRTWQEMFLKIGEYSYFKDLERLKEFYRVQDLLEEADD